MTDNDLEAVCELEGSAYQFPWSQTIISGCKSAQYRIWLGELFGHSRHVSQAFLSITSDEVHILNLAVEPNLQDRGLGGQMLRHLVEDVQGLGARQIFLEVRESNQAAIKMYSNQMFNEIGRRRHYYPTKDGREDAIIFGMEL